MFSELVVSLVMEMARKDGASQKRTMSNSVAQEETLI
jgi:hypothetical protein